MSSKKKVQEEEAGAIDLTPMLDVVFIMLIFFIVTATFIKEPGIEVDRPESTEWIAKPDAAILVALNSNDEIYIDKKKVDPRNVRQMLERLRADNPKGSLVIQSDGASSIETIQTVVEAATELGILDVAISTEKK
jgi:biopolymer transport protein ExbD